MYTLPYHLQCAKSNAEGSYDEREKTDSIPLAYRIRKVMRKVMYAEIYFFIVNIHYFVVYCNASSVSHYFMIENNGNGTHYQLMHEFIVHITKVLLGNNTYI